MSEMQTIQWFPGHMTKTKRQIQANLKLVDAVAEIIDARIPVSSRNPDLDMLIRNKPRVILMNKCDMANQTATKMWIDHYARQRMTAIAVDCKSGRGLNKFPQAVASVMKERIDRLKAKGMKTLAIVNVVGSTIAHEADHVIYTHAGPEIAVATTKAYSSQLIVLYALAMQLALVRKKIDKDRYEEMITELLTIPDKIAKILEDKGRIQWFAAKFSSAKDIFFVGRGLDYSISLEGSLKAKEISYVHSEAYAAGELKHGTISLIEENTLVIGVLTQDSIFEKTISNMAECKARGAYLMALTSYGNYNVEDSANFTVYIPKSDPCFMASLAVVPLQLFGYYIGVARGLDVDKPRNLAKSVTVE